MEQNPLASQPTEQQQPSQNPQPHSSAASAVLATASASTSSPITTTSVSNPSSAPTHKPQNNSQSPETTTPQSRPPFNTRPWQQPSYSHFSLPSPPLPASSAPPSSLVSAPPPARGGMAIGVPVHNPSAPPTPPASFSSLASPSYGQQSQVRQPLGMPMISTQPTSSVRPTGVPSNQLMPSSSSLRPQTSSSSQSSGSQSFQGHGMLRVSSLGSPGSPSPSGSQSPQTQPWLSSGTQGRPPLPTASLRPQTSPQPFQLRSHIAPLHHHNTSSTTQEQHINSNQQSAQSLASTTQEQHINSNQQSAQSLASGLPQEYYGQQFHSPRIQQPLSHQQINRGQGLGAQRPIVGVTQSGVHPGAGAPSKTLSSDPDEFSNRIIRKRSIHDLVNQIDPSQRLDPEIEDSLIDIAEEFLESIITFGCALAKHRKSTTLEAKDILLHLERNWNMTLPGFGGDEIKTFKKPVVSEIHKERLAAVKKSLVATDATVKSSSIGTSGGTARSHMAKGPGIMIGSPPNPKV